MEQSYVLDIGRQGIEVAMMVSLPIMAVTLFLGLLVSIFQAVTQVQEMTLTFVPKLIVIAICLALFGGSIMMLVADFTQDVFARIPEITR